MPPLSFRDFREIKAQYLFEKEMSELRFPQYQDGSFKSNFKLAVFDYLSLLTTKSMLFFVPNHMKCSSYRNIFSPPIQDCCRHPHYVLPTMDWCQRHPLLCTINLPISRPHRKHCFAFGYRCSWYSHVPRDNTLCHLGRQRWPETYSRFRSFHYGGLSYHRSHPDGHLPQYMGAT